jgi:hypothetical protein
MNAPIGLQRAWFKDSSTGIVLRIEIACVERANWLDISTLLPDMNTRPWIRVTQPEAEWSINSGEKL